MRSVRLGVVMMGLLGALGCDSEDSDSMDASMAEADGATAGGDAGMRVDGGPGELVVPEHYEFESRFAAGESSVSYSGQMARHLLIVDLKRYVDSLTAQIDGGDFEPAVEGDVTSRLEYFFSVPGADRASDPFLLATEPAALQSTYGDVSGSAYLLEKLAGNDAATDHRDWSEEFAGWDGAGSPTQLVRAWFDILEANAIDRANSVSRLSPAGEELPVHVTAEGWDVSQLLAKFLLGAVAFSQGADDYTDDDIEGKGIRSDNTAASGGAAYTPLEHAWDEAFGYFGANRAYGDFTAAALAGGPTYLDSNGDDAIDLRTEYAWGASVNAAKRDHGSAESARTDFMGEAWLAFRTGRAIITHAGGELTEEEMTMLRAQRDIAIGAWEKAIAATVVHYINDVLQVMADFDTAAYDHGRFLEHAKAWSEMKGFALMFQFNPRSPLSREDFLSFHQRVGDAPVLPAAGETVAEEYRVALREARAILGAAYGFDAANLGDDDGANGW